MTDKPRFDINNIKAINCDNSLSADCFRVSSGRVTEDNSRVLF